MLPLRDHSPTVIDEFNGFWSRGDDENCPPDHWRDCNNVQFIGTNKFGTRDGLGISQTLTGPLGNIVRIYNFPQPTGNTVIILTYDGVNGKIYHFVNPTTVFGPVLTVAGMSDFAFVPYAGRGYISPFTSFVVNGLNVEKGLSGQPLYVYKGDGTAAFSAAGAGPGGALSIANGAAGFTDAGFKVFGVVFEFDTGYLSPPGALNTFTTSASQSVSFGSVPTGPVHVIARHIVASKTINTYNGNLQGYQLFFIPNGTINDNTTLFLNNVSFFDADLLEDASHLFDNFTTIPAGAVLGLYHNRLCLASTFTDTNTIYVSTAGEPEAISQVDGLLEPPNDGNPITNLQELRDVLYAFRRTKTTSYVDNGDVPASWIPVPVDNALGTAVHGVGTVLDSGSTNVDQLLIATYEGFMLFNGRYMTPELSWKVDNFWRGLDQNNFRKIQILNNPIEKEFYIVLPTQIILVGNYANGMDPKTMRWSKWSFTMSVNTIAIFSINTLIIGSDNS